MTIFNSQLLVITRGYISLRDWNYFQSCNHGAVESWNPETLGLSTSVYWYCRAVSSSWFVAFIFISFHLCRRSHIMAPIHPYPSLFNIISIRVTCTWTVAGLHLQILNVRPSEWHSHRRETACVSGRDAAHSLAPLVLLLASRAARWVSPWMQRWEKIIPDWGHRNEILATMRRPTVQVGLLSIHLP